VALETVASAARNNAELCAQVAGTGTFAADAWATPTRTPPLYPDAVTLVPGVAAEALLARIDRDAGASVKDSYADLDLAPFGFHVLFEAQWIHRHAAAGIDEPSLAIGELRDIAGPGWSARLNRSDDCVGASNVVTADGGDADETWEQVVLTASTVCPGLPLVGYERGADLATALRHGFSAVGPLRVWIR
jgi:hypothetical protein